MAQRMFDSRHNQRVDLAMDNDAADYFRPTMEFLQASRFATALQANPPIYMPYIRAFWRTLQIIPIGQGQTALRATVEGVQFTFRASNLRTILDLGALEVDQGRVLFPEPFRHGALRRMGYVGALPVNHYRKSFVFGQWRYLMHVFISAFKPTKTGHDVIDHQLTSAMLSLVYNKPYPFSRYIYNQFLAELENPNLFLYPRFVMMIINHFVPNLPAQEDLVQVLVVELRAFGACRRHHPRRAGEERPVEVTLFGALHDEADIAPLN